MTDTATLTGPLIDAGGKPFQYRKVTVRAALAPFDTGEAGVVTEHATKTDEDGNLTEPLIVPCTDPDRMPYYMVACGSLTWAIRVDEPGTHRITDPAIQVVSPEPPGWVPLEGPGVPTGGSGGQALVKASSADLDTEWTDLISATEKGVPGGVATLDSDGRVTAGQVPSAKLLELADVDWSAVLGDGEPADGTPAALVYDLASHLWIAKVALPPTAVLVDTAPLGGPGIVDLDQMATMIGGGFQGLGGQVSDLGGQVSDLGGQVSDLGGRIPADALWMPPIGLLITRSLTDVPDGGLNMLGADLTWVDGLAAPSDYIGAVTGVTVVYGDHATPSGGNLLAQAVVVLVKGSNDAHNETGAYIGATVIDDDDTGHGPHSAWGISYTIQGGIDQPGALQPVGVVLNNRYNGTASRVPLVGIASIGRPGSGDGVGSFDQAAPTYTSDYAFAAGGYATGNAPQWRVGFRAGGRITTWMEGDTRSKLVLAAEFDDWMERGLLVLPPHPDADGTTATQVELRRRDTQTAPVVKVTSADGATTLGKVNPDGSYESPAGVVLTSPDGGRHRLTVANDGTLSTAAA